MWGSMSPPKPRGTLRTYRVQLLKTGRSLHPTREVHHRHSPRLSRGGTGCLDAWRNRETRIPQKDVPARVSGFESQSIDHTPSAQPSGFLHPGSRPGLPHEDTVRTPRTSSDPTVPYPQAGPTRLGSPTVAGHHTSHTPYRSRSTVALGTTRPRTAPTRTAGPHNRSTCRRRDPAAGVATCVAGIS